MSRYAILPSQSLSLPQLSGKAGRNGNKWTVVYSSLTMTEVSSLLVAKDDILFSGTFKGMFRTIIPTIGK
jgi:hypothetical protein